jgi:hypothetical protein
MKFNDSSLYLLYREDNLNSSYEIIYLFNDQDFIEDKLIKKIRSNSILAHQNGHTFFAQLEDLARFCLELCLELKAPEIYLLSLADFNQFSSQLEHARQFKEFFRRSAEVIANPEYSKAKKGLFDRFFKE